MVKVKTLKLIDKHQTEGFQDGDQSVEPVFLSFRKCFMISVSFSLFVQRIKIVNLMSDPRSGTEGGGNTLLS